MAGGSSENITQLDGYVMFKLEEDSTAKAYLAEQGLDWVRGAAHYEFLKAEKISAKKEICVVVGNEIYTGEEAREMADIEDTTAKQSPGDCDGRVFVQTTSANRKFSEGDYILYKTDKILVKPEKKTSKNTDDISDLLTFFDSSLWTEIFYFLPLGDTLMLRCQPGFDKLIEKLMDTILANCGVDKHKDLVEHVCKVWREKANEQRTEFLRPLQRVIKCIDRMKKLVSRMDKDSGGSSCWGVDVIYEEREKKDWN
eukprot:UN30779